MYVNDDDYSSSCKLEDGICDESAEPKDAGDHHHHHQDIKSLKKTKGDGNNNHDAQPSN